LFVKNHNPPNNPQTTQPPPIVAGKTEESGSHFENEKKSLESDNDLKGRGKMKRSERKIGRNGSRSAGGVRGNRRIFAKDGGGAIEVVSK